MIKSEEHFRSLVEQSPLPMELLNLEGRIYQVNAAWSRLWNLNEKETVEVLEKYNMLTDEQTMDLGIAPLIKKAFEGENVVLPTVEYSAGRAMEEAGLDHIKGQTRWVQCHLFPIKNPKDEIVCVVNTYIDISELKHAEAKLEAYRDRLRALASEITLNEERERRLIATELHDGATQSLSVARMQLESVRRSVSDANTAQELENISQILRESLGQIRDVLLNLSSPSMNEIGLGAAISEWLEQQIGRRHGLKTSFEDECEKVPFDDDVRAVLFRNTRELLINIVKHAEAKTVSVRMSSTGDDLRISIADDGAGFKPKDKIRETYAEGFGLFSIRELMLDLGGSLELSSAPGQGCRATLIMPLKREWEKIKR